MKKITSTNPSKNHEFIGEIKISTEAEVRDAVKKANSAKEKWAATEIQERIKILSRLHSNFTKRKREIAELISKEMGMPITQSKNDADAALDYFKWYLDNAEKYLSSEITYEDKKSIHKIYYEPYGVAAVISPWNFPFSLFVWAVMPNLIAGNTVVHKHSKECILSAKLIEQIINESRLPDGVFAEIYGDGKIGDYLAHQNVDLICFTGSTEIGMHLYNVASKKLIKAILELGGSAPGIVMGDADVDNVLETIYFNRFINTGQACDALKRLIVHESRFDEVVKKLKTLIEAKKIGDAEDKDTEIGPLVNEKQLTLLETQVKDATDKGAKAVTGGKRANLKGSYYLPTLLIKIKTGMKVWKEEVFGPVLPVIPFKTEEEAINLANNTQYGLGAYIFTKDKDKAMKISQKIKSGMVSVNNTSYLLPQNPFGGYKKSGFGREHGKHGLRDLCQVKIVSIEK